MNINARLLTSIARCAISIILIGVSPITWAIKIGYAQQSIIYPSNVAVMGGISKSCYHGFVGDRERQDAFCVRDPASTSTFPSAVPNTSTRPANTFRPSPFFATALALRVGGKDAVVISVDALVVT